MSRIPGGEATGSATWSSADIVDLTGRVALVTGANSGIGYETAKALADHGAHVIMACRNEDKARQARDKMESELDRCSLELLQIDLADLVSVRRAAETLLSAHARLDLLINNAGVMGTPYRLTADGFELQMGTNHFGHFALTGLLLDRIVTTERSRIVTVSSHLHRTGRLRAADPAGVGSHNTWMSYGASKLANLLFSAELSRRLVAAGLPTLAVAAHPGWTRSNLAGSGAALGTSRVRRRLGRAAGTTLGQSTAAGALPILCAATSGAIRSGQYVGPAHLFGLFGPPRLARPSRARPRRGRRRGAVARVRGADRGPLLRRRPRLNATAAGTAAGGDRAASVALQEGGVARRAVRPQDPAEHDDHHRAGAGPPQRRRGALGPGAADVRVVEEHGTPTGDGGRERGGNLEGPAGRPHVADGCLGPGEQLRHPVPEGGTGGRQPVHAAERRPRRPCRRRDREREVARAACGRDEAARRGRTRTPRRARAPWARSAGAPRAPATPCIPSARCRAGPAAGTGAPGRPAPGRGRGGGRPAGRRSTRRAGRTARNRFRTPRVRAAAPGRGQAAGGGPWSVSGSGRCRRKVPVARLTSTPPASRSEASP